MELQWHIWATNSGHVAVRQRIYQNKLEKEHAGLNVQRKPWTIGERERKLQWLELPRLTFAGMRRLHTVNWNGSNPFHD
jgi:hypothetical protein